MLTTNINDQYWFHTDKSLCIAGNMLMSENFKNLQCFLINNKITTLDVSALTDPNRLELGEMSAPLLWSERMSIEDATNLLEHLQGTEVYRLNLSGNCQSMWEVSNDAQLDAFVDKLLLTEISSLDLTGCTMLHTLTIANQIEDLDWVINEDALNYFINKLRGSKITQVLGITHPELTRVLGENLTEQKKKMIAFGQASHAVGFCPDVITNIISFTTDGARSGLSMEQGAVEDFDTCAADLAKNVFMRQAEKEYQQEGSKQTGTVLKGELNHLNDKTTALRPLIYNRRGLFFSPANDTDSEHPNTPSRSLINSIS